MKLERKAKIVVIAIGILLLIGGGFFLARILNPPKSPLPSAIASQLSFTPLLIPVNNQKLTTSDYQYNTVDSNVKLLLYTIHDGSTSVHVSQYPQPPQFSDLPDFKNTFLNNVIQQSSTVSTASGTVYVGKSAKQNTQLAVMLENGLIVFMLPDNNATLSNAQWHTIGDTLTLIRTN